MYNTKKLIFVCEFCNKLFSAYVGAKYCSLKCYWKSRIKERIDIKCNVCEKVCRRIEKKLSVYCSKICADSSKSRRQKISIATSALHKKRPKEKWYKSSYTRNKTLKAMSDRMKRAWQDEEYAAKIVSKTRASPNKLELKVLKLLARIDSNWEFVGDGKFVIGHPPKNPDFVHRQKRLILEVFGSYWHDISEVELLKAHYKKYDFECIVIWDYEIAPMKSHKRLAELMSKKSLNGSK